MLALSCHRRALEAARVAADVDAHFKPQPFEGRELEHVAVGDRVAAELAHPHGAQPDKKERSAVLGWRSCFHGRRAAYLLLGLGVTP